jgi:hypothetical protein
VPFGSAQGKQAPPLEKTQRRANHVKITFVLRTDKKGERACGATNVFIQRADRVLAFDTLLEVLILKTLSCRRLVRFLACKRKSGTLAAANQNPQDFYGMKL